MHASRLQEIRVGAALETKPWSMTVEEFPFRHALGVASPGIFMSLPAAAAVPLQPRFFLSRTQSICTLDDPLGQSQNSRKTLQRRPTPAKAVVLRTRVVVPQPS